MVLPAVLEAAEAPCDYVHKAQLVKCTKYRSLSPHMMGVDVFTKLAHLRFIQELDDAATPRSVRSPRPKGVDFYRAECERLQQEVLKLRGQLELSGGVAEETVEEIKTDEDEDEEEKPKKEIKIPFVKIEDEAFLIEGRNGESMCVTACDGELNPPFISAKGINWLKGNFDSNELDIFVDTYAKCGTTVACKMVS